MSDQYEAYILCSLCGSIPESGTWSYQVVNGVTTPVCHDCRKPEILKRLDEEIQKAKDGMIADILADLVKELPDNPQGLQSLTQESTANVRAANNQPTWAESKATNE